MYLQQVLDYTWNYTCHRQCFADCRRQSKLAKPAKENGEFSPLYLAIICALSMQYFLHDKKDNFFKQCSFLKIHFYRLILTFNCMARNRKAKIKFKNFKKMFKIECQHPCFTFAGFADLPVAKAGQFADCWRQRKPPAKRHVYARLTKGF